MVMTTVGFVDAAIPLSTLENGWMPQYCIVLTCGYSNSSG